MFDVKYEIIEKLGILSESTSLYIHGVGDLTKC